MYKVCTFHTSILPSIRPPLLLAKIPLRLARDVQVPGSELHAGHPACERQQSNSEVSTDVETSGQLRQESQVMWPRWMNEEMRQQQLRVRRHGASLDLYPITHVLDDVGRQPI